MKILVVSDTHRRDADYYDLVKLHKPDMVVHCGDAEGSEEEMKLQTPCPLMMVLGNNDYFSDLPRELAFELRGLRIWVTHGHRYGVNLGPERIIEEAKRRGCDVVMYGHTHKPCVIGDGTVTAINPGSLSYPRQEGRKPSYIIMEFDRFGQVHYTIAYVK